MRRQQSGSTATTGPLINATNNNLANNTASASRSRLRPTNVGRVRPASATGHYTTTGTSNQIHHGRSPSAGSLMAHHQHQAPNRSPGGYNYHLGQLELDPNCPVHQHQLVGGNQRARRGWRLNQMSSSHPDLITSDWGDPMSQQKQQQLSAGANLGYKPNLNYNYQAGTMPTRGRRPMSSQSAYYNSPGRFSLFHRDHNLSPSSNSGAAIRSSLAPPNEQLRRILGHKPSNRPRPVHLHPQWAYSRPFAHLQQSNTSAGRALVSSAYNFDTQDQDLGINVDIEQEEDDIDHHLEPEQEEEEEEDGDEGDEGAVHGLGGHEMLHNNDNLQYNGTNYAQLESNNFEPIDGEPITPSTEPQFAPMAQLIDTQAIRAVDFHPSGEVYAVGSNSRMLRICAYPAEHELRRFNPSASQTVRPARVLFKFLQLHRGSIYCVAFNEPGRLLATGSNDQTVHLVRYNSLTHSPDGDEFRLTMHNGTIRDLCFIDDSTNGNSLLLSGGGGDNKIYVTDCDTVTPFQSMAGHTQMIMGLQHVAGAQFVSASYDKTIRFWDLRSRSCTSIVSAPPSSGSGMGAPVCSLRVDPSGRLMATGHIDSTLMLYDIRGSKIIQSFRAHDDEIRAISFSPKSYYLLTGAYDGRLILSDLQGDLTQPLPSVCVAETQDKIVQAKWHPNDFTFVSTGADKTATLWAQPQFGNFH